MNVNERIAQILDKLIEFEPTVKVTPWDHGSATETDLRHRGQSGNLRANAHGKADASPPPGVILDGDAPVPISISPYAHFRWQFEHADDPMKILAVIIAAERTLEHLNRPARSPRSDDDEARMKEGPLPTRDGDVVQHVILERYVGWLPDAVDLLEDLKPGTTRRVRQSNNCDIESGERKSGVPKWLYGEFQLLDSIGGRELVCQRFQIHESSYRRIRKVIADGIEPTDDGNAPLPKKSDAEVTS